MDNANRFSYFLPLMRRGLFITFEGSEGCGKSTQIALLAARLQRQGTRVEIVREPGGTPLGESVRHLLKYAPEGVGMCAETELLLFTASRAQLVRERIRPALASGTTVLSDRFLDSTTVYQGVARRLSTKVVAEINAFAVGDTLPDITFILDLPSELAWERRTARDPNSDTVDRMESEPQAFYEAVREGYLALARQNPGRMRVLDGARSSEIISEQISAIIDGLH